jgi:hypothetical protein
VKAAFVADLPVILELFAIKQFLTTGTLDPQIVRDFFVYQGRAFGGFAFALGFDAPGKFGRRAIIFLPI